MPLWVNAANAVLVPSEREGFGLAVLEALACDVPVLATPVGIHAEALDGSRDALRAVRCELVFDAIRDAPPRIGGRERAIRWGADAMAQRVLSAWKSLVDSNDEAPGTGVSVS